MVMQFLCKNDQTKGRMYNVLLAIGDEENPNPNPNPNPLTTKDTKGNTKDHKGIPLLFVFNSFFISV